jgi:hypothetical protein
MQFNADQVLYVRGGLCRLHRVTALFFDSDTANVYLASTPTESVIAVFGSAIFIAASTDLGLPFPNPDHMPNNIRVLIESARIFLAEGDVVANRAEADNRLAEALTTFAVEPSNLSGTLRAALEVIVANAEIIPDPHMSGATDIYAVPLDDIDTARAAISATSPSLLALLARLRDMDAEYNHETSKVDLDWTLPDAEAIALLASWRLGST